MSMNILVINLPNCVERLAFQEKQLKSLGLDFTVLKAISTNDISDEMFKKLGSGWERPLRKSELACFISHKKAWEVTLETNQPTLILEDDALLSNKTKDILDDISSYDQCDLITLEVRSRKKIISKTPAFTHPHFNVFDLYQDRTGAAGYVLWPSGAEKLINRSKEKPVALADAFISSSYALAAFQLEPAPIVQLDQAQLYNIKTAATTTSTISAEKRPASNQSSQKNNLTFKFRRIYSQLRIAFRQITTIHKSNKRYIRINPQDFSN